MNEKVNLEMILFKLLGSYFLSHISVTFLIYVKCIEKDVGIWKHEQTQQSQFSSFLQVQVPAWQIALTFLCLLLYGDVTLSRTHLPLQVVLYSTHGNEYIDLHLRPQPEVAEDDDNISAGSKLRRLKMEPREYR